MKQAAGKSTLHSRFLHVVCQTLFLLSACPCVLASQNPKYQTASFAGKVAFGQHFKYKFGSMDFQLNPEATGFRISIMDSNKSSSDAHSDLSWITPPLHGLTDRDINATDFRNEDNSGPNKGTVNRPQRMRRVLFSKRAAELFDQYNATRGTDRGFEIFSEAPDGICEFRITHLELSNLGKGKQPQIKSLAFRVHLKYRP
jgi:hypothetical protein